MFLTLLYHALAWSCNPSSNNTTGKKAYNCHQNPFSQIGILRGWCTSRYCIMHWLGHATQAVAKLPVRKLTIAIRTPFSNRHTTSVMCLVLLYHALAWSCNPSSNNTTGKKAYNCHQNHFSQIGILRGWCSSRYCIMHWLGHATQTVTTPQVRKLTIAIRTLFLR